MHEMIDAASYLNITGFAPLLPLGSHISDLKPGVTCANRMEDVIKSLDVVEKAKDD